MMEERVFVVAEAGVNHNGDAALAMELVDIAAEAGADAVKFQTFRADRLATPHAPKARYQVETTGCEETQYEMLKRLELSPELHVNLMRRCAKRGIEFMSTPFDEESADFLAKLPLQRLKLPSGEITNIPFLSHVARLGLPLIVSTGMSSLKEVDTAVSSIRAAGNGNIALLHCVSEYPASSQESNLRAMQTMRESFGCPIGWSDHTEGIEIALAAVALGARIIEKHFTKDRSLPGPDHRASLDPSEIIALVRGIRKVESALGDGRKQPTAGEMDARAVARKSLVAATFIKAGATITADAVNIRRPGTGLSPARRDEIIGRRSCIDIPAGTVLTAEMLI